MKTPTATKPHDFSLAYSSLRLFSSGPLAGQSAEVACGASGARFEVGCDLSPLFPFINAVAAHAQFYDRPVYIKFLLEERLCAFYPHQGAFTPVRTMADALTFLPRLLDFITDIATRCARITPNHKTYKPVSAVDIYRLLPGTNCRRCGLATCLAFAAALSRGRTAMEKCPHLARPIEEKATFPVYDQQGKLVRTVSLDIDTTRLREQIGHREAKIRTLQMQLSTLAKERREAIARANAGLPAPLTAREIQVLRQVADGATNREISAALKISPHTVKSHVIHIFNKIGVNDRAQAAAWGARHDIL
ncbi:Transcriptional regulator, LuxR family [Desulfosarcina cetonica]|uniref:LuxR C-terminal-related transcriptional regulator n=1 Tax=Desulfosarcina cetonica TaxID=90730 RepID=UPI0006D0E07F|nr:LuxR C-terminal-related transcriptional regulator [Desulfosarcina cetonica]VTR69346.1 Transcriptional regulator, LuxR family [Desulfosarcina cetonica]